jgi:hypothetical protein
MYASSKGTMNYTKKFFERMLNRNSEVYGNLKVYAQKGVAALSAATPVDTGETANSWGYKITMTGNEYTITWTNKNVNDGANIAILLQYGHATGTGGYVSGYDYINPAIRPIFDEIKTEVWANITKQ